MTPVVSTTVTEIDASNEANVAFKRRRMADHDHLLMMRSAASNSLIEKNLATCLSHFSSEISILFRTERETVAVRTPEQSANIDVASTSVSKEGRDRGSLIGHEFIAVTAPIGEAHLIEGSKARDGAVEPRKIGSAIDQKRHEIAFCPRNVH